MPGEHWTDDGEAAAIDAITGRGTTKPRWLIPLISAAAEADDSPTAAEVYSARLDATNYTAFEIGGAGTPDTTMSAPAAGSSASVGEMLSPELAGLGAQRTITHYALVTTSDDLVPSGLNFPNIAQVLCCGPVTTSATVNNGGRYRIPGGSFAVTAD